MRNIHKIIFIILAAIIIVLPVKPAKAQGALDLDIEFESGFNSGTGLFYPLFTEANFVPGDNESHWVEVTNNGDEIVPIAAKAVDAVDNGGLGSALILTITEQGTGVPSYSNSLADFFTLDGVYLSDLAGNSAAIYDFTINFNETATSSYQGKTVEFDIIVGDGTDESIGGENDEGGGSGGGYYYNNLVISNENVARIDSNSATITWLTNKNATSRVIYDTVSHSNLSNTAPPNYGYASSTDEDTNKKTGHSVSIADLTPDTTYYFRPLSKASPEKYGKELSFTTTKDGEVIVLGEEGMADLTIEKNVKKPFANPGDAGIEYEVVIFNKGNLAAYNVSLIDSLPNGLAFNGTDDKIKTWIIGDIDPGKFKSVIYSVDVDKSALKGIYTNTAEVYASNFDKINAMADLEIREVSVLGAEFIKSGFSLKELIILAFGAIMLFVIAFIIRKKHQA